MRHRGLSVRRSGINACWTPSRRTRSFTEYGPRMSPLPHPSWRSRIWMKKNPWFEAKLLPLLRRKVKKRLQG
jgi:uracil-DNA glycosylase